MLELPQRMSLPAQTAAAIRRAVTQGAWREHLPSERRLCDLLRVSRPTVRTAIGILAKEGLVDIRQGRVHRIVTGARAAKHDTARHIGLVTQEQIARYSLSEYHLMNELRAQLFDHGFTTEFVPVRKGGKREQLHQLETFVRQHPEHHWLLCSVSENVQRWFADRGIPALVMGSCHAEVKLPSIDIDYRAVARHAVGIFSRLGHRRLALIVPDTGLAGDRATETGFRDGLDLQARQGEVSGVIVRHDDTMTHLNTRLRSLFQSQQPPTALIVASPWHAVTTLLFLLRSGRAVPERVSLICRDQDPMFENILPALGHYRFEDNAFVNRLVRQTLKLVDQGLAPEPSLIFPQLFQGSTVQASPE